MAWAAGHFGAAGFMACATGMVMWAAGQDHALLIDFAGPPVAATHGVVDGCHDDGMIIAAGDAQALDQGEPADAASGCRAQPESAQSVAAYGDAELLAFREAF